MTEPQRRVVCAANLNEKTGQVVLGVRHFDNNMRRHIDQLVGQDHSSNHDSWTGSGWREAKQGFVDQWGVFMDRYEAWKVAEEAGQILKRVGGDTTNGGKLFSENLY